MSIWHSVAESDSTYSSSTYVLGARSFRAENQSIDPLSGSPIDRDQNSRANWYQPTQASKRVKQAETVLSGSEHDAGNLSI
jgi:hypothetical protein